MRALACPNCQRLVHFEVRVCPGCTATLGYDPEIDGFRFLADNLTTWRDAQGQASGMMVCANNNAFQICNWLVAEESESGMCRACRHNRTIPDLSEATVPERWAKVEAAKRRLFHTLIHLGLPLETKAEERPGVQGLAFDFLYDPQAEIEGHAQVLTGHDDGLITLNLIEADDVERERIRRMMHEPYRTLLGHFRHEVGHHFWSRLVESDAEELAACRALFGDDTQDYAEALAAHYSRTDDGLWGTDFVSFYATSHPWEDFAETFAHYLHIVDFLASARGFDLSLSHFPGLGGVEREVAVEFDPYRASAPELTAEMGPLSFAMNTLNRAMGQPDLYPFHIGPGVVEKLDFMARLAAKARARGKPVEKEVIAA